MSENKKRLPSFTRPFRHSDGPGGRRRCRHRGPRGSRVGLSTRWPLETTVDLRVRASAATLAPPCGQRPGGSRASGAASLVHGLDRITLAVLVGGKDRFHVR